MISGTLEILIKLQDLEHMLEELNSPEYLNILKESSGLSDEEAQEKIEESIESLKKEIEGLKKSLPKEIVRKYNRLIKRYGRAVVPVVNETCLNCFSHIPTSFLTKSGELVECPNCGAFLYLPIPDKEKKS